MHSIVPFLSEGFVAYIDPNAGGWLFQMIFPVFVAIGGAWVVFRKKVSALWKRIFGGKGKKTDDNG